MRGTLSIFRANRSIRFVGARRAGVSFADRVIGKVAHRLQTGERPLPHGKGRLKNLTQTSNNNSTQTNGRST